MALTHEVNTRKHDPFSQQGPRLTMSNVWPSDKPDPEEGEGEGRRGTGAQNYGGWSRQTVTGGWEEG